MSKIVLKNGSTIAFTGDGDKLTGCQPDWVMRHLIYDCLTDEQKDEAKRAYNRLMDNMVLSNRCPV